MVHILNLRQNQTGSGDTGCGGTSSLASAILDGLTRSDVKGERGHEFRYSKHIPTMVLYDDKGLDLYDAITDCDEYYLFGSELDILRRHAPEIAGRLFASTSKSRAVQAADAVDNVPALTEDSLSSSSSSASTGDDASEGKDALDQDDSGDDNSRKQDDPDPKDSGFQELPQRLDVKEKWGDGSVGKNNFGVNGNFGLDNTVAPSSGSLIELGAGSLKKTSVLLRAIYGHLQTAQQDSTGVKDVTYYALDLEHAQLVKTLEQLETTESDAVTSETTRDERGDNRITIKGICAAYEEAFPVLKDGKYDSESSSASSDDEQRTSILFLGSSIGNYARDEAVAFLKQLADEAMKPGDTLLIGLDSCDDKATIERAYNDSQKLTEQFILNGVDHVDRILGGVGLKQTDFRYTNTYNKEKGRHEAYITANKDISFEYGGRSVTIKRDEHIRIERSYKYTLHEAQTLFGSAGFRVVQRWTDTEKTGNYHLWLLEKPPFHFESVHKAAARGVNMFGLPSLHDWDMLWKAWDCITLSMIPADLLHSKPIDLRHICLFYLGHIPGFLDIHMSRYLKEGYTEPAHYPDMFERGIDPNMDDPSKVHAHSVVPTRMEDWPSVADIVAYRDRVRARLHSVYASRLSDSSAIDTRLARTMGMVYEHEAMHLETLLYMCAQITPGKLNPAPCFSKPDFAALSGSWDKQVADEQRSDRKLIKSYSSSSIAIGHDDFDHLDRETAYDPKHAFGWDNESPKRQVEVPAFSVSMLPISNKEYHEFWTASGMPASLVPGSWLQEDDGSISVRVLTTPGKVELDVAKHWPCMASGKQLEAHAKHVGGRLPTEPELRRFIADNPVDHAGANIGFANWHPVPARLPTRLRDGTQTGASNGGVWEWTSTNFEAWEGWRAAELYPDYSRDFFDGCHWVMLGGSFATIPRIAGRTTFTNWYQANYPYVFAGARVAYDN